MEILNKLLFLIMIGVLVFLVIPLATAEGVSFIKNPQTNELLGTVDDDGFHLVYHTPDGTLMTVTDEAGNVEYNKDFKPFGEVKSESGGESY